MSLRAVSLRAATRLKKAALSLRHSTEAVTLAGEEKLGSPSMEMTLSRMESTLWVGRHRSSGSSPLMASTPGGWRIDIHTGPSGYTLGRQNLLTKVSVGGLIGKSGGNFICSLNTPPAYGVSAGPSTQISHENTFDSS